MEDLIKIDIDRYLISDVGYLFSSGIIPKNVESVLVSKRKNKAHVHKVQAVLRQFRGFVKVLEALVKWTSELQNSLVHTPVYSSTIFIAFTKLL